MPAIDSSDRRSSRIPASARLRPPEAARFAVALAAFAAIRCFALTQADPAGGAESAYLALLVGGVVAVIAAIAPRPAWELGWTALLATTAIWIVEYGPHRGALVTVVVCGGLAVAAGRGWLRGGCELRPELSVPLALGAQLLMRCDLLLPPLFDPRTLVSVLALPAASGLALSLLATRFGHRRALVAGGAAVVLSPGWNVTVTMALVALAAGTLVADRERSSAVRWAAAAVLLVPPLWNLPLGLLFSIGGLALSTRGKTAWLVPAAAALAALTGSLDRGPTAVLTLWAQGMVLIPALVAAPPGGRQRVLHGVVLALAAAVAGGGPEALAGGVALAALGLPVRGGSAGLQWVWSGALAAGTTLVATYPWVRSEALAATFQLVGLDHPALALVLAATIVGGFGYGLDLVGRKAPHRTPRPAVVGCALLVLALVPAIPTPAVVPVLLDPVTLEAQERVWVYGFRVQEVSGLVIDSHLTHSVGLEAGTVVGTVRLSGESPEDVLESWPLLVGTNTGEWAAARPDIAGRPGFEAPPPWLSRVASDGTFFAQRFRSRFTAAPTRRAGSVSIHRSPEIPPEVRLVIYRVELRR
ncbi:MAG: hypothetical protein GY856_30655 [bacterium]|nr:hypothetical protein [bacterium]